MRIIIGDVHQFIGPWHIPVLDDNIETPALVEQDDIDSNEDCKDNLHINDEEKENIEEDKEKINLLISGRFLGDLLFWFLQI